MGLEAGEFPRPFPALEAILFFLILFFPPEVNPLIFPLIVLVSLLIFIKKGIFPGTHWLLFSLSLIITLFFYPSAISFYYVSLFLVSSAFIFLPPFDKKSPLIPLWTVSLYGVYQLLNWPSLSSIVVETKLFEVTKGIISQIRLFSRFALPTTFGAILGIFLPLVLEDSRKRVSSRALAGLMIFLILMTRSLGAILVSALSLGVYFYMKGKKKIVLGIFVLGLILSFAMILVRGSEIRKHPSWKLRAIHWQKSIVSFVQRPVTGIGWRRFPSFSRRFLKKGEPESLYVHNAFLQFLTEGGVVPLIGIFILMLGFRKRKKISPVYLAGAAGWILHNFIDIGFYFSSVALLGGLFFTGIWEPEEKNKKWTVFIILMILSTVPFIERSRLSSLKWAVIKQEKVEVSKLDRFLFSYDDEAQIYLFKYAEDASYLERSIEIYPENPYPYYLLSLYELEQGNLRRAEMMAKTCLLLYPESNEAKKILEAIEKNED